MTQIPAPLVDVAWLAGHIDNVLPVDCRWILTEPSAGRRAYDTGHIPGAVYASLDDDLSDMSAPDAGRHPLPTKEAFAATLGRLGIGNDAVVVAYDDAGGAYASRLWWLLRWVGHGAVAVLDGGLPAWTAAGLSTTTDSESLDATDFTIGSATMPTADRAEIGSRSAEAVLIDARGGDRYRGETEPLDPVAGHIPGAVSAPFAGNLAEGSFASTDAIAARFDAIGVDDASAAIVYCGSGVTACHDILAMELAGLGTATLYPGSWSEWSRAGGDVATGE